MADQKSRGGQKQGYEHLEGKKNRDVHIENDGKHKNRDMAEDAQRGQQSNQGGYPQDKPQSGKQ